MKHRFSLSVAIATWLAASTNASAINIVIDYTLDTGNFFSDAAAKTALEAAADRYSNIITSSLSAVAPGGTGTGTSDGWRVGFTHPGDGSNYEISTSANSGSDPLIGGGTANAYGFGGLNANEWILYAGGRSLGSDGAGGTGTGVNFGTTFDDTNGPMHRGFDDNQANGGHTTTDLPRWGGSISFNTGTNWHFDLGSNASAGSLDFYSIALHEIGHALGLSGQTYDQNSNLVPWNQSPNDGAGNYSGSNAVDAYNADNATSLTSLNLEANADPHWQDSAAYQSYLFPGGESVGTVGDGVKQDLLMEPTLTFDTTQKRFELTNVDVAALEDIGWSVIPEPSSAILCGLGFGTLCLRRRREA